MDIKQLQSLYNASGSNIKWAKHCLERMQERDISINDVESCLHTGEIIEDSRRFSSSQLPYFRIHERK